MMMAKDLMLDRVDGEVDGREVETWEIRLLDGLMVESCGRSSQGYESMMLYIFHIPSPVPNSSTLSFRLATA